LEGVTDIDLVINLRLPENVLLEKCLGRRICNECGGNFNVASIDIKADNGNPGIVMAPLLPPTDCITKLITRSDDTEAVVKERLRIYNELVLLHCYIIIIIIVIVYSSGLSERIAAFAISYLKSYILHMKYLD
jgi:adenylate kinase family enzyme